MNQWTSKRSIFAWCLFDWANSAFPVVITTFVFATYFTSKVATNKIIGTTQWAIAIGIASLFIAILSPLLGSIADSEGQRKPWLALFSLLCIIGSAMLWFVQPNDHYVHFALIWVVIATIGLDVGMVFYNAMLDSLGPKTHLGRLSGWSWGLGYFGGLACLVIALFVFIQGHPGWLGLSHANAADIRICGPLVALWFLVFGWPLFVWTYDRPSSGIGYRKAMSNGVRTLIALIKSLKEHPNIVKFLIARLLYIDGLNTIFAFGGIYAAGTFHMSFTQVMEFGIAMNVAAGIGAIAFAWLDDFHGSKHTILITMLLLIGSTTGMLLVHSQRWFWILGMGLSLSVGPIQAASRSLLIHISPKEKITELFGLYSFSGKATSFLGPWLLAGFTLWFHNQRAGMATVLLFLISGAILLLFVKGK